MAIIKKGSYGVSSISGFDYLNLNLATEENTETLKFDKDEYLELIEEAKKEGYENGFQAGLKDGYSEGVSKFEQEKESLYLALENDKNALASYLNEESINYVNTFKNDIFKVISDSINKLFLGCVNNEILMTSYLEVLIKHLIDSEKTFSLSCNSFTNDKIEKIITGAYIDVQLDETLANYDVSVFTAKEN